MSAGTGTGAVEPSKEPEVQIRIPLWRPAAVLVFFGVILLICGVSPNPNTSMQSGVKMQLPDDFGGLYGIDQAMSAAEKQILPADTQFLRRLYRNPSGDQISCSIVLAGGEKRSIHRPEVCLPGQGWTVKSGEVIPVTLNDGRSLEVMKLNLERDQQVGPGKKIKINSIFMVWFIGKGVTRA